MLRGEDGTHEVKSYPRANSLIGRLGESMWTLPARQPCGLSGACSHGHVPRYLQNSQTHPPTFLYLTAHLTLPAVTDPAELFTGWQVHSLARGPNCTLFQRRPRNPIATSADPRLLG